MLCSPTAPAFGDKGSSKARTCSDIQRFYGGKGFNQGGVPQFEMSGKLLQNVFILETKLHFIICGLFSHAYKNVHKLDTNKLCI